MTLHCFGCGAVGHARWAFCDACGGWYHFVDEETHLRLTGKGPPLSDNSGVTVCGVVPDKMHKHFDWAVGAEITSRSQKRRLYDDAGMIMVSAKDEWRDKDKPRQHGFVASYAGQKNHQSSADRGGVRTKTGQRVV